MRPSLAFRTWDRSSSVRSRQHCYTLSEDDLQNIDPERWFPPYIAPLLNHPKIKALPTHQRLTIHQAHLIYFLDYTTDLEIEHVNNAVHAMTYGALSRHFLPETHQAALKLYVDEGYHALFSRETADQISAHLGIERKKSSRLSSLLEYVKSTHEEYRHMAKFVIGFISETLITEELLSLSKESLVPGVYNLLRDHLHDESKHSIYFSNCFQQLIPKISEKEKFFLTQSLIDVLLIFCRPDREFIKSLFENNLELADALISELEQQIIIRLKEISKKTLHIVSKTELFNNHRFRAIFDYNGVLP